MEFFAIHKHDKPKDHIANGGGGANLLSKIKGNEAIVMYITMWHKSSSLSFSADISLHIHI